jgi:hypothetical protein
MPFGAVFGLTLIVTVSIDGNAILPQGTTAPIQMSLQQKNAALRPLLRSATDCIVRTVGADPRLPGSLKNGDIRDLIVDSMSSCVGPVRAMIDTYDQLFGEGSGEAFFMGPYLDVLPTAVSSKVKEAGQ